VTDPVPHTDPDRQLAAVDAAARNPVPFEERLRSVEPMTDEFWDSLAIEDLTEEEAETFLSAIAE